jgi:REP element-mobilizing transposase RayT
MRDVREKKHRLPRAAYQGRVIVSITARIEARRTPFVEEAIVLDFIGKLSDAATKNHCRVPIYCFMPDHAHLLFQGTDDSADVSLAMVAFKQKTGYWFGQHRSEFCWQKDFHDHVIRGGEDLGAHIRYIAGNPVRWDLVKDWREYRYTGAIGFDLNEIMADTTTL